MIFKRSMAGLGLMGLVGATGPADARINTWTSHGPGGGGYVSAVAIAPTMPHTLYAAIYKDDGGSFGDDGGIFKSTDGGDSWRAANAGLSNTVVLALAIDPSTPSTLYGGEGRAAFSRARTAL